MRQISYWAKDHVWQSRLIIVLIYVLLNAIGIFTGQLLSELNVALPQIYFTLCLLLTVLLWLGYPSKKRLESSFGASLYARRKTFDFLLGGVTFLMIVYTGNNWEHLFMRSQTAEAAKGTAVVKDTTLQSHPQLSKFVASIKSMDVDKLNGRQKIKIIKDQVKAIQHSKDTSNGEKTALIILSVMVALALLFGLAALSCSISCGGAEALALIVAGAGTVLIIFLLVHVIKRINNPKAKRKEKTEKLAAPQTPS